MRASSSIRGSGRSYLHTVSVFIHGVGDFRSLPASNSNFRLTMFIRSLTIASIGARASENRRNPITMGCSLWKPKDWYRELLFMKTEKRAKM